MPLDQDETFSYRGWVLKVYYLQRGNMWHCDANYPGFASRLRMRHGRKKAKLVDDMKRFIDRETPQE